MKTLGIDAIRWAGALLIRRGATPLDISPLAQPPGYRFKPYNQLKISSTNGYSEKSLLFSVKRNRLVHSDHILIRNPDPRLSDLSPG